MKRFIRNAILALNYGIVLAVCLIALVSPQFTFLQQAGFGFGAIFLGMGIQRLVRRLMPEDERDKTAAR